MTKHPFLLTMPAYGGSVAAVRCLGRRGVDVSVACPEFMAAARWSRYATRFVRCPPLEDTQRFLAWLIDFGDHEPKHVLYPTSDDLAYLIASNAAELGKRFLLYQPPVESIVRLQDKKLLHAACETVGLASVPTWYPEDEADLRRIAGDLPYPVLIKPRTQVMRIRQTKGVVVHRQVDLLALYRAFVAENQFRPGLEPHFPTATKPMIQRFLPSGVDSVWSVSGFIDRRGTCFAVRAARKVFLRTYPVGLGLCFEAAPLKSSLVDAAVRLCRATGYFGVFEVEFMRVEGRDMVIDFNPRFYGQMGFDEARGLPLAFLAWLGATDAAAQMETCLAEAAKSADTGIRIFVHRFVFELVLLKQRLNRSLSAKGYAGWRRWLTGQKHHAVDAFADVSDPWPGVANAASELLLGMRSVRKVFRTRSSLDTEIQPRVVPASLPDLPAV